MSQIHAFVGHSFTPDDEHIVDTFLKYFEQVEKLHSPFNWCHAKAAEPTELAKKVLTLVNDCNVFIGICTNKEYVGSSQVFKKQFLNKSLVVSPDNLSWKTSDWIIQEIGLAVGRDMSIILLLEKGCRKPGGLQGDVEFIPFDRTEPEKSFGQLLEMIQALSPASRSTEATTTDGPDEKSADAPEPSKTDDDDVPDVTWDKEKFQNAFFLKLVYQDVEGANAIETAYLASSDGKSDIKSAEWQAWAESWRLHMGQGGSLQRINEISDRFPDNVKILEELASVLGKFDNNLEAAEKYLSAADKLTEDIEEAERFRRMAALQFARAEEFDRAEAILNKQRTWVQSRPDQEIPLLKTLQQFAELKKDDNLLIEVLERIVKLMPDDSDSRFSLAYNHSEKGNQDLALHHYLQIPKNERSSSAWNNLGVSFQHFQMNVKSVQAYRRSAEKGGTLAMSNLGYKHMHAGFVDEAKNEFDRATKIEGYHKNIDEGIAALRGIPDKEEETEREVLNKAKFKIAFYQRLGFAIVQPNIAEIPSTWQGPICNLAVKIVGNEFHAFGEYERPSTGLGSGLMAASSKPSQHKIEYIGTLFGRRVFGTVKRAIPGDKTSALLTALGSNESETKFSLIIDKDGKKISVSENPTSTSPSFYDLTAISNPEK